MTKEIKGYKNYREFSKGLNVYLKVSKESEIADKAVCNGCDSFIRLVKSEKQNKRLKTAKNQLVKITRKASKLQMVKKEVYRLHILKKDMYAEMVKAGENK